MSSSNKSPEKSDEEEFKRLKMYIEKCPDVPLQSRAVQVALASLDMELSRMERDAKLKRKFSASALATAATTGSATIKIENEQLPENTRTNGGNSGAQTTQHSDNDDELMAEWQDVAHEPKSLLGASLAQLAVGAMSQHQISVKTPLAALALALHATLCTSILGFACTGVPENPATSKGFAPPIRELPKGQFVPPKWEEQQQQSADQLCLRYRKTAVGSVILTVALEKDHQNKVHVHVKPANSTEPPSRELVFNLDDHINLESFQRALQKEGSVLPALHYKDLPTLLTNFANTVDIGPIRDNSEGFPEQLPYMDATAVPPYTLNDPSNIRPSTFPDTQLPTYVPSDVPRYNPYDTPTTDVFRIARPQRGDFAGDLHPPGIGDFMGNGGGNLMGPNHPMFGGSGSGMTGGGFGMRPRFDPFGPPGGPQDPTPEEPQPPTRRPPPGGFGDPNPDHLRPPNNLNNNNNMFM